MSTPGPETARPRPKRCPQAPGRASPTSSSGSTPTPASTAWLCVAPSGPCAATSGCHPSIPATARTTGPTKGGPDVDVHGGLTYADRCQGTICHVPESGRSHDVWWFGFDCAHAFDLAPMLTKYRTPHDNAAFREVYRDLRYVKAEVTSLAKQLAEVEADRAVRAD
jgi:hypothetical protein